MPAKALRLYDKDDSGGGHVPHPGSNVEARNRIDYCVYQSLNRFLEGKGLLPFWNRFADNITQQMHELYNRTGTNWEYRDDLMKVVSDEATVSILNALCGPYLLSLNPHFLQDYWDFDRDLQTYLQGTGLETVQRRYHAYIIICRNSLVTRSKSLRSSEKGVGSCENLAAARERSLR